MSKIKLKIITPPATEPLTLAEGKHHLRVDENEDDASITSLIKQAREYCEDYQGKKYITQTLEAYLDNFPCGTAIEFTFCSPVQSIESIKYIDCNGTENTIDQSKYIFDGISFVNKVVIKNGAWPTTQLQEVNGIKIQFVAGYGNAEIVPESVKWAMAAHMKILADGIFLNLKDGEKEKFESVRDSLLGMRRVKPA